MGITVGYLLSQDYFKDFTVITGHNGLNREIQGVTVWDCPDCFKWTLGKELVVTNGYSIIHEADYCKHLTPEIVRSFAALVIITTTEVVVCTGPRRAIYWVHP